jgi:hypothetical protein
MSDTNQDDRLRLVPLVATLADIKKPSLNQDQIFDLAMKGEIRLYVRLPSEKVAYVDMFLPIVNHRRSSVWMRDMGDFTRYNPLSSRIHREITHVALDCDQAGELKTGTTEETKTAEIKTTTEDAFASGLMQHPDDTLAQAGWLIPCEFGGSIVICPAPPESESEKKLQRVRRTSITTISEDVYVDAGIVALLTNPQASNRDDPFQYCDHAPGVYALYCAARDYHAALKEKRISFEVVQAEVAKKLPMLDDDEVLSLIKFIRPRYRRNSGVPSSKHKQFDKDIVDSPMFIARYRQQTFINDALGLVFYVTDRWLDSLNRFKQGIADKSWERWEVRQECSRLGFYDHELEALVLLLFERQQASRS